MKFLDLFAGIGGFRLGLESAGHECVGFCEIDKFARKSYKAIYNTEGEIELHDITKVTNEEWRKFRGTVDIICGGFPCQAFSIAGKRKGFLDETRGTLFFEIARAAKEIQPPLLFLENVKGLLSHDKGRTFRTILSTLDELGYDAEWQVLNSKDFGVPQNRERVFIIGRLRGTGGRQVFPIRGENEKSSIERLGINILGNTKNPHGTAQGTRDMVHDPNGIVGALKATDYKGPKQVAIPVLTPDRANKRQNGRRFKTDGEHDSAPTSSANSWQEHDLLKVYDFYNKSFRKNGTIGTLTANGGGSLTHCGTFGISDGIRIRKLTPRECWRLQGFPDWAFDKAQEVNSNSQLYKQAGNSVTVNVIKAIAERMEE